MLIQIKITYLKIIEYNTYTFSTQVSNNTFACLSQAAQKLNLSIAFIQLLLERRWNKTGHRQTDKDTDRFLTNPKTIERNLTRVSKEPFFMPSLRRNNN